MKDLRILLIDDHALFRCGLRILLGEANLGVEINEAESVEHAMTLKTTLPELILLDFKLPGVCGLDGIVPLKRHWPQAIVAMLNALDLRVMRVFPMGHNDCQIGRALVPSDKEGF